MTHLLPSIHSHPLFVEAGGLMEYAISRSDIYRQAGSMVADILGGDQPSTMPFHQPTKFQFRINLKTANLTASQAVVMARCADRRCTARTSLEAAGQGYGECPAHGSDGVRNVPLWSNRRLLGVCHRRE